MEIDFNEMCGNDIFHPSLEDGIAFLRDSDTIGKILDEAKKAAEPDDFHEPMDKDLSRREKEIATQLKNKSKSGVAGPQVTRRSKSSDPKHGDTIAVDASGRPTIKVKIPDSDNDDGGFCMATSSIRKFVMKSADNLAAMIMMVIASQGKGWHTLHVEFPMLMFWYKNYGLFPVNEKFAKTSYKSDARFLYTAADGKERQTIPIQHMKRFISYRGMATLKSCNTIWSNRVSIYGTIGGLIKEYDKRSKDYNNEELTNIALDIYANFLSIPGLGLPKAGFATQLAIGRFGCVDSINTSLYTGAGNSELSKEYPGLFGGGGDKTALGKLDFKRADFKKNAKGRNFADLTPTGQTATKMYVKFLSDIKRESQSSESQQLWADWTKLVANKLALPATLNMTVNMSVDFPMKGGSITTRDMESYRFGAASGSTMLKTLEDLEKLSNSEMDSLATLIGLDHYALTTTLGDEDDVPVEQIAKRIEKQLPIIDQLEKQAEKGLPSSMIDKEKTALRQKSNQGNRERVGRITKSHREKQNESSSSGSMSLADMKNKFPDGVKRFMQLAKIMMSKSKGKKQNETILQIARNEGRKITVGTMRESAKIASDILGVNIEIEVKKIKK